MAWEEAKLERMHVWDEGLVTVVFDRVLDDFESGQFVNLGWEIDGQRIKRQYSVASAPGEKAEFFIIKVDNGALTPRIVAMKPGDTCLINPKAAGFFTLKWIQPTRDLWLVASGTGLAPFISLLRTKEPWERFENIVVLHGVRTASQLGYADEMQAHVARSGGRLHYLPIVSREPDAKGVIHGRTTTALADGQLEKVTGLELTPSNAHVMLCGNPAMLDEMQAMLEARGLQVNKRKAPGHITVERYW
ncbi:MAG: ferredoxin--NADP reductase [Myxococcales bacterium]|nr:ferredoxin--NADP reductase [Myxococcales bacterium]